MLASSRHSMLCIPGICLQPQMHELPRFWRWSLPPLAPLLTPMPPSLLPPPPLYCRLRQKSLLEAWARLEPAAAQLAEQSGLPAPGFEDWVWANSIFW